MVLKYLITFLLSTVLAIQPVLAEGLMLADENTEITEIIPSEHHHNHHMTMHDTHMHSDMTESVHSDHNQQIHCCESGTHFCQMLDCETQNCSMLHAVSAVTSAQTELTNTLQLTQMKQNPDSLLISRAISPELRPPLV